MAPASFDLNVIEHLGPECMSAVVEASRRGTAKFDKHGRALEAA